MEGQEDVKETSVEQTTETESSPVEAPETTVEGEQTTEMSDETPVSESTDTDKVSKTVPYERFKEINDKYKELEDKVSGIISQQKAQPQYQEEVPELDPDAARAVDYRAEQKARAIYESQETAKFQAKHGAKFDKDPLLQAAFMVEVNQDMAKGKYVDREAALERAEKALQERLKPAQDAAKQEGVKEGQDIAKTKQQLNAVGTPAKAESKDDSTLSASELAAKYNIPRSAGY